jgi:chromosomal replication initiation ATPase DnaA
MDDREKFQRILAVVGDAFQISEDVLTSHVRHRGRIGLARQIVMYLARVVYELPYKSISRFFFRDRSVIATAVETVEDYRLTPEFDALLNRLEKELTDEDEGDEAGDPRARAGKDHIRDDAGRGVHAAE